jgi:hypothetical protein
MIVKKTKQPKAPWVGTRNDKRKARVGKAAGMPRRSDGEALRMAVYWPIASLFLKNNQMCRGCPDLHGGSGFATEVHHQRGRDGLLLFDTRFFVPLCGQCHQEVHAAPDRAKELGLLAYPGHWGKLEL